MSVLSNKISIVMAYYNRRSQLLFTLKTIQNSDHTNFEIIIVNDASKKEEEIDDIPELYSDLKIRIINIRETEKNWVNPCIAYNIGFKEATGDIILIQNPEVCHIGDCIMFVDKYLEKGDWLSFNCYGLDNFSENHYVDNLYSNSDSKLSSVFEYIDKKDFKIGGNTVFNDFPGGWLNNCNDFFVAYHYMAAIFKEDLVDKMGGGFYEGYKDGVCKDDNDFIKYLIHNKFSFKIPRFEHDRPFCIHQYHDKTPSLNNSKLFEINDILYKKRMNMINASESCDIVTGFMPKPVIV